MEDLQKRLEGLTPKNSCFRGQIKVFETSAKQKYTQIRRGEYFTEAKSFQ